MSPFDSELIIFLVPARKIDSMNGVIFFAGEVVSRTPPLLSSLLPLFHIISGQSAFFPPEDKSPNIKDGQKMCQSVFYNFFFFFFFADVVVVVVFSDRKLNFLSATKTQSG